MTDNRSHLSISLKKMRLTSQKRRIPARHWPASALTRLSR